MDRQAFNSLLEEKESLLREREALTSEFERAVTVIKTKIDALETVMDLFKGKVSASSVPQTVKAAKDGHLTFKEWARNIFFASTKEATSEKMRIAYSEYTGHEYTAKNFSVKVSDAVNGKNAIMKKHKRDGKYYYSMLNNKINNGEAIISLLK